MPKENLSPYGNYPEHIMYDPGKPEAIGSLPKPLLVEKGIEENKKQTSTSKKQTKIEFGLTWD